MPEEDLHAAPDTPAAKTGRSWRVAIVLLLMAAVASWLIVIRIHQPVIASCLMILTIGWTLYRYAGASRWGIIFWIFAAAILCKGVWTPIDLHAFMIPRGTLFILGGFILALPAGVFFLVASTRHSSRCIGNCAGCMMVLFTLVIYITSGSVLRGYRAQPEAIQETRQLLLTLHRLSSEIEAIRMKLGRLPNNEEELVAIRGKPMPPFYREFRIHYYRNNTDDYRLHCSATHFWGRSWDIFGWIICFHGPDDIQRLQVILF